MVDVVLVAVVVATVVIGLLIGFLVGRALTARAKERELRRDSVTKSCGALGGQMLERLAPHFPDFPYDPTEIRFLGTPVDYIVFRGLSAESVEEVVFLEVKSGKGRLSTGQRGVRDAVQALKVRWAEYKAPFE